MELFWWCFGISLIVLEFVLPGLVSIFVGLGAVSVAALLHYQVIDGLAEQVVVWFASSLAFIFSLRVLVIRFYPSDTERTEIETDDDLLGMPSTVVEEIPAGGVGRVAHSDSTWKATSQDGERIMVGEDVQIAGRDNITWIVKRK